MNKPKTIFKYEPFSAQSLQNLKAQSIYFGSPLGFNDPYDCALTAGIQEPTLEELEKLRQSFCQKTDVPKKIQQLFETTNIENLREIIKTRVAITLKEHSDSFLKNRGVSCFSERNDDLLMWSQYGGRYKGFCMEFSTEHEPFSKMRKVKYSNSMPKINVVAALLTENFDQILDLFCTKSESWSYEREWRSMHQEAGTLFTYETDALESIYFGPDIDTHSKEIICLIVAGQNPNVKLWEGKRSEEKFEVIFKRFSYVSHVEAKRYGLVN